MAKTWKRIIIHCSDSGWGSSSIIRQWHLAQNWSDIGYHFVVCNGSIRSNFSVEAFDGAVEVGRNIDGDEFVDSGEAGAHAYGFNSDSIGVCLIGSNTFTPKQIGSLLSLVGDLMERFNMPVENVLGHYELDAKKTCPNLNMEHVRYLITKTTGE